jgi:hypothetical protein
MEYFSRFINAYIPMNRCNLRCGYCYIGQTTGYGNSREEKFLYSLDHMREALSQERMGGICMFNCCADGETMLWKPLPDFIETVLKLGHYATIVTNNTLTEPLREILKLPGELRDRLFFKCSLQYLECKRLNLLDAFFRNIDLIKRSGTSFTVELTANDESVPHIAEIKEICAKRLGALCHIIESRYQADFNDPRLTKLPLCKHLEAWGGFASPLFDYQQEGWGEHIDGFCCAGDYRISLNLSNGEVYQCDRMKQLPNLFENAEHFVRYHFAAVGANCPLAHCYARHYQSCLCDCFAETPPPPTYAEERDRVCTDGSHWLTPTIREVFSHRLSEFHAPYTEDKKYYIDLLMRKVYGNVDPTEHEKDKLAAILRSRVRGPVAIIGEDELCAWLLEIFAEAKIRVKFTVDLGLESDPNPQTFKNRLKRKMKYAYKRLRGNKTVGLYLFDRHPKTECVIVTDYVNFGKWCKTLGRGHGAHSVKSVLQLAD